MSAKAAIDYIERRIIGELNFMAGRGGMNPAFVQGLRQTMAGVIADARRREGLHPGRPAEATTARQKAGLDCAGKSPHTLGDHGRAEGTDCGDA